MSLTRPRLLTVALVVLACRVASAQTTTTTATVTSGGSFPITLGNIAYANLSSVDCKNNAAVQITFTWVQTWIANQIVEYFLSNDTSCTPPAGGPISIAGTTNVSTNALIETLNPQPQPSDGMTTVSDPTTNLTVGGIWAYESDITAAGASTTAQLVYKPAGGDCTAVVDSTAYLCIGIQQPTASVTTTTTNYIFAYFPFTMDSEPPAPPATPTVTSLDSGLSVSWPLVTDAFGYIIHVQNSVGMDQGQSPVTITGGGLNGQVYGLTNNVQYTVFVNSRDNAGSNPPATANVSADSPAVTGTPQLSLSYFQVYTNDGGTERGGCSNTAPSLPALFVTLGLRWRRRRTTTPTALS